MIPQLTDGFVFSDYLTTITIKAIIMPCNNTRFFEFFCILIGLYGFI